MSAKTIMVATYKGGVGKTTISNLLSQALSLYGKKVLLIDLDEQRNATVSMGMGDVIKGVDSYEFLLNGDIEKENLLGMVKPLRAERTNWRGKKVNTFNSLFILPATTDLCGMNKFVNEQLLVTTMDMEDDSEKEAFKEDVKSILKINIDKLRDQFDYIVIDTHPDVEYINEMAMIAADVLLIPIFDTNMRTVEASEDVIRMFNQKKNERGLSYDIKVLRSKKDNRMAPDPLVEDEIDKYLSNNIVGTVIHFDSKIEKAANMNIPLFALYPTTRACYDVLSLCLELNMVDDDDLSYLPDRYSRTTIVSNKYLERC